MHQSLKSSKTGTRYDAFVSYSHRDEETVRWLADLLRNHWVPFRRRRRIFLDHATLNAGQLETNIVEALASSRWLIVCASADAAVSEWVPAEIRSFRETQGSDRILVCRVGDPGDAELPAGLPEGSFMPDLRGKPAKATGEEAKRFAEQALALLAPIMGFADKNRLSDVIARRRHLVGQVSAALLLLAGAAFIGWRFWLSTPDGMHYQAKRYVLDAADSQTRDDPYIIPTAVALAAEGRSAVVRFAGFYHADTFRPLALAAGFASLEPPDCASAIEQIALLDADTVSGFPEAILVAAKRCDPALVELARGNPDDEDDHARWARRLAAAGFGELARQAADRGAIGGAARFDVLIALGAAGNEVPEAEVEAAITDWLREEDTGNLGWPMLEALKTLDLAGEIGSSAATPVLTTAFAVYSALPDEQVGLYGTWSHLQQAAAHLAGASRTDEARQLLDRVPTAGLPDQPSHEPAGWAWRGLALHRLGRADAATAAFERAEEQGLAPLPQSRTWGEWRTILETYALAGRWRSAFRSAGQPPSEQARLDLRMRALELWAMLGN